MKYDKLKNLNITKKPFDFICPECGVDGLKKGNWNITPVNIAWRPDIVDNSDIKDKAGREALDNLPTLRNALLETIETKTMDITTNKNSVDILIMCNKCKMSIDDKNLSKPELRKWLNRNIPEVLNLKLRDDQIARYKSERSNNR